VCLYPDDGNDGDALLAGADTAMYRAKEMGRDRYCFYTPAFTASIRERIDLETSLRRALERGEFRLLFQPQVSAVDGKLLAAEALLRWRRPDGSYVAPSQFVPIAEDIGLIGTIGEWVLRTACREARFWHDSGLTTLRIAINWSGRQITDDCVELISRALSETGLPAHALELEISESFVIEHAKGSLGILDDIKELGVTLAVDDFGAGYTSIAYLKRLPIQKLKIDQSLVRDIPADPNDEAIARTVVAMGHSLGLSVIAEGVETHPQRAFLCREGCDVFQGFLYGRPVSGKRLMHKAWASRARGLPVA
jgi:EAL domain-containing protein (putative c-di-GMP-specific phosphodiesterase class I)